MEVLSWFSILSPQQDGCLVLGEHLDGVWSSEPATTTRIKHDLYEKVDLMRTETVDPGAMVDHVQALNKVPLNAVPNIIRAVLFCPQKTREGEINNGPIILP